MARRGECLTLFLFRVWEHYFQIFENNFYLYRTVFEYLSVRMHPYGLKAHPHTEYEGAWVRLPSPCPPLPELSVKAADRPGITGTPTRQQSPR